MTRETLIPVEGFKQADFVDAEKVDSILTEIAKAAASEAEGIDLDKGTGRTELRSVSASVSRTKIALDEAMGKTVARARANVAAVDKHRRVVKERLDTLRDATKAPAIAWEENEAARIAKIRLTIDNLRGLAGIVATDVNQLGRHIIDLEAVQITEEAFQEFRSEADQAKAASLALLRDRREAMEREALEKIAAEKAAADLKEAEAARLAEAEAARIAAEADAAALRERLAELEAAAAPPPAAEEVEPALEVQPQAEDPAPEETPPPKTTRRAKAPKPTAMDRAVDDLAAWLEDNFALGGNTARSIAEAIREGQAPHCTMTDLDD